MPRGKKAGAAAKATAAAPKKLSPEDQFTELAESVISDAEAIKCSFEEFMEGLDTLRQAITDRLMAAKAELRGRQETDEDEIGFGDDDDLDYSGDEDEIGDEPTDDDF